MKNADPHNVSTIADCRIIGLDVYPDVNGKLAVIENGDNLPFDIKRCFFLYDVPSGAERGGHSHFEMSELIIALTGAFHVVVDDGIERKEFLLNKPNEGLLVPPGLWRELNGFTSGAVCLALASTNFSEEDYVREYDHFLQLTASKRR